MNNRAVRSYPTTYRLNGSPHRDGSKHAPEYVGAVYGIPAGKKKREFYQCSEFAAAQLYSVHKYDNVPDTHTIHHFAIHAKK